MPKFASSTRRRYAFCMPVEIERTSPATERGLLIELSQDCARISQLTCGDYEDGEQVTILATPERRICGAIRNTGNGVARVRLDRPLTSTELYQLVERNRQQQAAPQLLYG